MRLSWRVSYVRVLAYALLGFQIVQSMQTRRNLSPYMQSYWLVTYRHGFVRRGLTGELIRPFDIANRSGIAVLGWCVAAATVIAVIVLMELLFRRRTAASCALGVLLACSPFVIGYATYQRRPDLLGIPILIAFGIGLLRVRGRRAVVLVCCAGGLAFGIVVLIHEAAALYALPWAFVMVGLVAGLQKEGGSSSARPLALIALLAAPALVTLLVVGFWGRASTTEIAQLKRDASSLEVKLRPDGTPRVTMLDFLHDTVGSARARVQSTDGDIKLGNALLGTILVGMQGAWLWWWARPRLDRVARSGPLVSAVCVLSIVVGAALLFLTGVDWLRWVALIGSSWLVTCGVSILARDDGAVRSERVEVPILLPVAAIYLAAIPPLHSFRALNTTIRSLTFW